VNTSTRPSLNAGRGAAVRRQEVTYSHSAGSARRPPRGFCDAAPAFGASIQ
jgi:hypothetical protein